MEVSRGGVEGRAAGRVDDAPAARWHREKIGDEAPEATGPVSEKRGVPEGLDGERSHILAKA